MDNIIILASTSKGRAKVCWDAGLQIDLGVDAGVNEDIIKSEMIDKSASAIALKLSKLKALSVSKKNPEAYVIGGDQTLSLEGKKFDKPLTTEGVKKHIMTFSGKNHTLHSGICVARGGEVLWAEVFDAEMHMRELTQDFIDNYVSICGEKVKSSVGGYHFEGLGAQLFKKIGGDYFTILGLPLLPLLEFLRTEGVIAK